MSKQSKPSSRTTKAALEKALAAKIEELKRKDRLLEIEAALERVRARSMAMHQSQELADVSSQLFHELSELDFDLWASGFVLCDGNTTDAEHWMSVEKGKLTMAKVPVKLDHIHSAMYEAWKEKRELFTIEMEGDELKQHYNVMAGIPALKENIDRATGKQFDAPAWQKNHVAPFRHGYLFVATTKPYKEISIFPRFAKVFEQTYQRFLDLQKAEAQAREAQIEAALEKVRNRTLLMKDSSELHDAAAVLFQQFKALDLFPTEARTYFSLIDTSTDVTEVWMTKMDGTVQSSSHFTPLTKTPSLKKYYQAWKRQEPYVARNYSGKELEEYLAFVATLPHVKTDRDYQKIFRSPPERIVMTDASFLQGTIGIMTFAPLDQEALDVLVRFAKVFEFTYTRFLDLQKAEAQAREAQIEAALERVRSRTMGMHKSEELTDVAMLLREELRRLGYPSLFEAGYIKWDEEDNMQKGWLSDFEGKSMEPFQLPLKGDRVLDERYHSMKIQKPLLYQKIGGQDLIDHVSFCLPTVGSEQVKQQVEQHFSNPTHFYHAFFMHGALCVITQIPLDSEQEALLVRFTKAFEQTYTRFLDLQKAEAQAREAQIEAALERVRGRSMAMHQSGELREVVSVVYEQLKILGFDSWACLIRTRDENREGFNTWLSTTEESVLPESYYLPNLNHHIHQQIMQSWNAQAEFEIIEFGGEEKKKYDDLIFSETEWKNLPETVIKEIRSYDHTVLSVSHFRHSGLQAIGTVPLPEEKAEILKRFAKVFEQTYIRFLDLKKAEAQAREAQIEAALERIRARAMAMHSSQELYEVIAAVFSEMKVLGFDPSVCSIGIFDEKTLESVWWMSDQTKSELTESYHVPNIKHDWYESIVENWQKRVPYFLYELSGDSKTALGEILFKETGFKNLPEDSKEAMNVSERVMMSYASMNHGLLEVVTDESLPEDKVEIIKRVAKVIDLTYTRFHDLQKTEARAREAIRDASLDRVRAEIASMRTADDLNRITPLIWRELTTLGVPFFRCGVFIVDEPSKLAYVYLSTPSGESLAAMHLKYGTTPLVDAAVESWRKEQVYTEKWDRDQFLEWTKSIVDQGLVESSEKYQAGEEPPDQLVLQFVPFTQGMLYVGSAEALTTDQIELVEALAGAFSVAYARYEDFKQLEEAKHRVEGTLHELKSAQSQLIQSEKMASLGELTAGIAHEIQNPLNFVNNFSEVNAELLGELSEELQNGNLDEAASIIKDMLENENKIVHHGRRAEAIVKSMLQHSRGSAGKKEPTDINALADEYLRLAYHGMRARDKSFNASMQTNFDNSIGKLNVVPQEIGRVLLNLITNGFYAVTERQKRNGKDYQPTVSISIKKIGDRVEIRVKDNGTGIPQKVLDKIFQPFFSTKPTGQGTGLGLSLSYDIVKAHGGELKVETEEGAGSDFVVQLPIVK